MLAFVWFALGMSASFASGADVPPPWNLARLVERATEASLEGRALEQEALSAEARARQASRWENPEIGLGAGPKRTDAGSGSVFQAGVKQSLPLFGQKAIAGRIGMQYHGLAEADRALRALQIRHQVVRLAYEYAAVTEQAEHVAHRREGLLWVSRYLNSRSFASPSQLVEKNLVQNRLREIEGLFLEVMSRKEKAWQALNGLLALPAPIKPDLPWLKATPEPEISKGELETLLAEANPEIARQKRAIGLSELALEQAGKKVYPDLRLGASYIDERAELRERTYALSLEFTLPVWDRGGSARDAAEAGREAEIYRGEQVRREISGRFAQAWTDFEEARRRVALFPPSLIPTLEEQFKRAEANWKRGLVPITPFLELEGQVHEQISEVFSAQADYVRAKSELSLLAGKDVRL
jgi:outer membrane protein TolC